MTINDREKGALLRSYLRLQRLLQKRLFTEMSSVGTSIVWVMVNNVAVQDYEVPSLYSALYEAT